MVAFNFGADAYSVKEIAAPGKYWVLDIGPDLIIASIIYDDFNTARTWGIDKWGYNVSYRATGDIDKDSIIKRRFRYSHLAYVIRDIRYSLFLRKDYRMESIHISVCLGNKENSDQESDTLHYCDTT